MRCRKVRSFLSAYSNDELAGKRLIDIREHLSTCSACQREETMYASMRQMARLSRPSAIPSDFNARLLNRIAHERFAETRTKAYFPRRVPVLRYGRLVPAAVMATATMAIALAVFGPSRTIQTISSHSADRGLSDAYSTVQPVNNPNVTMTVKKDWSMNQHMAQADRANQLSGRLTAGNGFGSTDDVRQIFWLNSSRGPVVGYSVRLRPVIRVYDEGTLVNAKEVQKVY